MMGGMTDPTTQAVRDMTVDHFERIKQHVAEVTGGLSDAVAFWRPDAKANSVCWLVWHLARVQDSHVADLLGREQVWTAGGWDARCNLPLNNESIGFGHSADDVGQVRLSAAVLTGYQADVHDMCLGYADTLTADGLTRIVDDNWDPPVTASARLVSLLGDCLQHAGQAAYVRGMAERAGIG